jgi:hypothetical protein
MEPGLLYEPKSVFLDLRKFQIKLLHIEDTRTYVCAILRTEIRKYVAWEKMTSLQ